MLAHRVHKLGALPGNLHFDVKMCTLEQGVRNVGRNL